MEKVRARISKTNRFREVTLRRDPEFKSGKLDCLYDDTPAYLHLNRQTVSGVAYETDYDKWVFVPRGANKDLVYK